MNNTTHTNHLADPLWIRIAAYPIDNPDAERPFSVKLAAEQGWTKTFTRQAIEEYKRFMYLCCISSTGASPSAVVDEVWHQHLTYTTDYWLRFCKNTLQKDIHHHPSQGGADEHTKHQDWYNSTIDLYHTTFGTYPPPHIWPGQKNKEKNEQANTDSLQAKDANYARYLVLLIPFVFISLFFWQPNPFQLSGRHFLIFFVLLATCTLLLQAHLLIEKKQLLYGILNNDYHDLTKYEQAWLSGGYGRVALLTVVELIDKELIATADGTTYDIDCEQIATCNLPLANSLEDTGVPTISSLQLKDLALALANKMEIRPSGLKVKYEKLLNNTTLLPCIPGLLAVARMVQGFGNSKPITILVMLTLFFTLGAVLLYQQYQFHRLCSKLLKAEIELLASTENDVSNQVILYGIAPLLLLPLYSHMRTEYNHTAYGGDGGSSGSGCGSGCSGGGCGGGCGGCGGD